jgi:predicted nucleotidyltransferase
MLYSVNALPWENGMRPTTKPTPNNTRPLALTDRSAARAITRMTRRLAKQFQPERIILFGSHARGDAGPDSDIDLLVVLPLKNPRREKAALELAMRLAVHDIKFPKDIIVVTPEEVERQRGLPGTLITPALLEGKTVYARQP